MVHFSETWCGVRFRYELVIWQKWKHSRAKLLFFIFCLWKNKRRDFTKKWPWKSPLSWFGRTKQTTCLKSCQYPANFLTFCGTFCRGSRACSSTCWVRHRCLRGRSPRGTTLEIKVSAVIADCKWSYTVATSNLIPQTSCILIIQVDFGGSLVGKTFCLKSFEFPATLCTDCRRKPRHVTDLPSWPYRWTLFPWSPIHKWFVKFMQLCGKCLR